MRQVFFNLPQATMDRVLADYKQQHGQAAYLYAKNAYGDWKSGRVQMSGLVSERLLAIVPRYLDFDVKYDLLAKLCRCRRGTRLRVEITGDMTAREAIGTVLCALETARSNQLPDHIAQRLRWLADNDGKVAQRLLGQVFAHEREFIVRAVQGELQRLLAVSCNLAGGPVEMQAQREIALPGAIVQIVLSSSSKTRRLPVPHDQNNQGGLVPASNRAQGGQLAPIQNPQNLLDEALKRMGPEKQAEVLGKAADEALRLQVKSKECDQDLDAVSDKIDQAGRVARDLAQNPKVNVSYETEHRSEQGDTRIKVTSKPGPFGCLSVVVLFVGGAIFGLVAWLA